MCEGRDIAKEQGLRGYQKLERLTWLLHYQSNEPKKSQYHQQELENTEEGLYILWRWSPQEMDNLEEQGMAVNATPGS